MSRSIIERVVEQLKFIPGLLQWQVLEWARTLRVSQTQGVPGQQLLKFAGTIPADDLQLMQEAIEEGCDRVDWNEW